MMWDDILDFIIEFADLIASFFEVIKKKEN